MGTLEPRGTPPRGGWCGDLRLRCPEKACTLGAVRGRFMLAASLPAVRFRQPIRPGYARATRVRQGRDTLWGCPERAYGCCDAGTGPWGIRKTRGFHLPCGGAGQAIVEKKLKKGFYVSQQISLNHSTLNSQSTQIHQHGPEVEYYELIPAGLHLLQGVAYGAVQLVLQEQAMALPARPMRARQGRTGSAQHPPRPATFYLKKHQTKQNNRR